MTLAARLGIAAKLLPPPVYRTPRFENAVQRSLVLLIYLVPRRVISDILLIRLTQITREPPIHLLAIQQGRNFQLLKRFLGEQILLVRHTFIFLTFTQF